MSWVKDKLIEHLFKGSTFVAEGIYEERKAICHGCDKFGTVHPLPLLSLPGCTICGCPLETKGKLESFLRLEENLGKPVTLLELIEAVRAPDANYIRETVVCDLNKWPLKV